MDAPGEFRTCDKCGTVVVYVKIPTKQVRCWSQRFDCVDGEQGVRNCPGCGAPLYYATTSRLPPESAR
jgi:hypothetical protein